MLKFISGTIRDDDGDKIDAVVFFLNHTSLSHADVKHKLEMTVKHAGFCDIKDSGFIYFYGYSVSLKQGIEGIDRIPLNTFVKKENIYHDIIEVCHNDYDLYLVVPMGHIPDYSLDFDVSEIYSFDMFNKEVKSLFKEMFDD